MYDRDLCRAYDLGIIGYNKALKLQEGLVKARCANEIPDIILFLQHTPVLTIGASGGEENLVVSKDALVKDGVAIVHTDRGGNITCHEPGQLVSYPIFDLSTRSRDIHQYVRNLEEVVIRALHDYSIIGRRDSRYPGVWVGEEKICALGIRITKWVTKHGFALNVNNELKYFSYIHPCGISNRGVTSMSRLVGQKLMIEDIILCVINHCSKVFNLSIELESPRHLDKYYVN
ncbi:lipoyl(octanoyl) transferase LipB [Chloroflexota bacterium]